MIAVNQYMSEVWVFWGIIMKGIFHFKASFGEKTCFQSAPEAHLLKMVIGGVEVGGDWRRQLSSVVQDFHVKQNTTDVWFVVSTLLYLILIHDST